MKAFVVLGLFILVTAPLAVEGALESLGPEPAPGDATLAVLGAWTTDHRLGPAGERLEPPEGWSVHLVHVRIANAGTTPLDAPAWRFRGHDQTVQEWRVQLGNVREDFDTTPLAPGHAREGLLLFELPDGAYLMAVTWHEGESEASAEVPPYRHL